MKDLEIILENKPGSLALLGETLGKSGISLEGGGVFRNGALAIAHFLIEDTDGAKKALEEAGLRVAAIREVIILKLRQDVPGQLGMLCRRLAEAGINILVQYSDHSNRLILVVDRQAAAKLVADLWMREWFPED